MVRFMLVVCLAVSLSESAHAIPQLTNPNQFNLELYADLSVLAGAPKAFQLVISPAQNGFPAGLYVTTGPLTGPQSDRLLRVSGPNQVTVVKSGFNSNESLIFAQGSYGNGMLITEPRQQRINRLLSDGTMATFASLGTAPFGPAVLAYGPDDTLYVTDFSGSRVLRVRPDGSSSTFATLPASIPAKGQTHDPGLIYGAPWLVGSFTAVPPDPSGTGAIFKVSASGVLTPFASNLDGLEFINMGPGGVFGNNAYLSTIGTSTTPGVLYTLGQSGTVTPFLTGIDVISVAFDTGNVLGGGMFVADAGETQPEAGKIWRITPKAAQVPVASRPFLIGMATLLLASGVLASTRMHAKHTSIATL